MSLGHAMRASATLFAALLLAGCLSTAEPVLEAADGEPLPGGAGTLRLLDEDGKPHGRLVLTALRGAGHRYRARAETVADGRKKVDDGEIAVKSAGRGRHLLQIKEGERKYLLSPAEITEDRFTVMVVDAETLTAIAAKHGVKALREPISGDRGDIERALAAGEPLLVLTLEGPVLHAPKDKALAIALEMARSEEAVPLEDGDWHRPPK